MGKKGNNWLAVLKRVFVTTSRDKPLTTKHENNAKERKRWGFWRLRHAPSSVEKILQEAEIDQRRRATVIAAKVEEQYAQAPAAGHRPPNLYDHLQTAQEDLEFHPNSYCTSEDEQQPAAQPVASFRINVAQEGPNPRPVPYHKAGGRGEQKAAIKIQTAFRGYLARRSYRAIRGLIRLQMMLRSQNARQQTTNTMKCMQKLVRVQTQINVMRLQMLKSQNLLREQFLQEDDREIEACENLNQQEGWDDSILTKEEIDARLQRKVEAAIQRERALAYAYSHQVWKGMSKSAQSLLIELRSAQLPWAWNWIEQRSSVQLKPQHHQAISSKSKFTRPSTNRSSKVIQPVLEPATLDMPSPRSSSSALTTRGRSPQPASVAGPPPRRSHKIVATTSLRDDESLTSCPQFASPNYMLPTISAHAKFKDRSKAQELEPTKRRLSFGSAKKPFSSISWKRGCDSFGGNEFSFHNMYQSRKGSHSPGTMSIDSAVSLPVGIGRKAYI